MDIGGRVVIDVVIGNVSDGAKEGRVNLRDQLLFAVKLTAKASAEGAVEAAFVASAMDQLMK